RRIIFSPRGARSASAGRRDGFERSVRTRRRINRMGKPGHGGANLMLVYKAMYKYLDDGVHAEVLDLPGVITSGTDLDAARRMLASALVDMAETNLLFGGSLPL